MASSFQPAAVIPSLETENLHYESDNDESECDIPDEFLCPITLELMHNPVITTDGFTYDECNIMRWTLRSETSPMTREPMSTGSWTVNLELKGKIDDWVKRNPDHGSVRRWEQFKKNEQSGVRNRSNRGADVIVASVFKPSRHLPSGVLFAPVGGTIRIAYVDPVGLFASSPLEVGDECISINGLPTITSSSKSNLASDLIGAAEGNITVVAVRERTAPSIVAMIPKATRSTILGLHLKMARGVTIIDSVQSGSLASHTPLRVGDVVVSINGASVIHDHKVAGSTLRDAVGNVSIVTAPRAPGTVVAAVNKATSDTPLGISLKMVRGITKIISIAPGGLISKSSPLQVGDFVLSVNGIDTIEDMSLAANMLREAQGIVTIVVGRKAPGIAVAKAHKQFPASRLGLQIGMVRGTLRILELDEGPPYQQLDVGDFVLSINGIDTLYNYTQALHIMKTAVGMVTIVAGKRSYEPSVGLSIIRKSPGGRPLGTSLKRESGSPTRIASIAPNGLVARTSIRPDDICLSVNGTSTLTDHILAWSLLNTEQDAPVAIVTCNELTLRQNLVRNAFLGWDQSWGSPSMCVIFLKRSSSYPIAQNEMLHVRYRYQLIFQAKDRAGGATSATLVQCVDITKTSSTQRRGKSYKIKRKRKDKEVRAAVAEISEKLMFYSVDS